MQLCFKMLAVIHGHITKHQDELVECAMEQLRDKEATNQTAALDFLSASFKKVRQSKELLAQLCNASKVKHALRQLHESFGNESDLNVHVRRALLSILVGILRRTSKDKAKKQQSMRKIIIESCSLVSKTFLHNLLEVMVNDELVERQGKNSVMVLDICVLCKDLVATDRQLEVHTWIVELLLRLLQDDQGKTKASKGRFLSNVAKVFQEDKAIPLQILEKHSFFDLAIYPFFENREGSRGKEVPNKIVKLLDTFVRSSALEYFTLTRLTQVVANYLKAEADDQINLKDQKMVDSCCLLVSKLEDKEILHDNEDTLKVLVEPVTNKILSWLRAKEMKKLRVRTGERFCFLRIMIERDLVTDKTAVETIATVICNTVIPMNENIIGEWFKTVTASLQKLADVPEGLFRCLVKVQNEEYKYKLGVSMQQHLKFPNSSDPKVLLEPYQLHDAAKFSRKEILFAIYGSLSHIMSSSLEKASQGLDALTHILDELSSLSREEFDYLCKTYLGPEVKRGIKQKGDIVHNSYVTVLQSLVKLKADGLAFKELRQIADYDDEDRDFFENVKHLQVHRRARIIRKIHKAILDGTVCFSKSTVTAYIYPMINRFLLNESYVSYPDVIEASADLLGLLVSKMSYSYYLHVLGQVIATNVTERPMKKQKFLIISKMLNNFNFQPETTGKVADKCGQLMTRCLRLLKSPDGGDDADQEGTLHMFPPIAKLAALQESPDDCIQMILMEISSRLRSRHFHTRKLVRAAIKEVMKILGPKYLFFLVCNMGASLQRGYQKHVLLYSVGSVLEALKKDLDKDTVEPMVTKALDLVVFELFTDFNKEKKVAAILKRTPEAKTVSSYQTLKILASHVSKDRVGEIVRKLCPPRSTMELLQKTRKAFKHVFDGFVINQNLKSKDHLLLSSDLFTGKIGGHNWHIRGSSMNSVLKEFALSLILHCVKTSFRGEEVKPIIPNVIEALDSESVEVVLLALKILHLCLSQLGLKSYFEEQSLARTLIPKTGQFLRRFARARDSQIFTLTCQTIEKLLHLFGPSWSSDDLALVKTVAFTEVEKYPVECSKILVMLAGQTNQEDKRELVHHICKTFVTSPKSKVHLELQNLLQNNCDTKYVLEFMMQNLKYEGDEGRLRIVSFIQSVIENVEKEADFGKIRQLFFLAAQRVVLEEDPKIRRKLEMIIKAVLMRKDRPTESSVGIDDTIVGWSKSKTPLQLVLSSLIAVLAAQCHLYQLCSTLLDNLKAQVLTQGHEQTKTLLKLNVLHAATSLLKAKAKRVDISFLDSQASDIVNFLLHPNPDLRAIVISLVKECLKASSSAQHMKSWESDTLCSKIVSNLLELLKESPSKDLQSALMTLWNRKFLGPDTQEQKKFVKKLVKIFNHERVKLSDTYERRFIVLNVLASVAARCAKEVLAEVILPLALRNQHHDAIDGKISAILKCAEARVGAEEFKGMTEKISVKRNALLAGQKRLAVVDDTPHKKKRKTFKSGRK